MKKLLFLLFVMFLFSCEKNTYCIECKIQQTATVTLTQQYCNLSMNELEVKIKEIEKENTFSHNLNGQWWNQTCKCNQIK